jgi:hypothetical protein
MAELISCVLMANLFCRSFWLFWWRSILVLVSEGVVKYEAFSMTFCQAKRIVKYPPFPPPLPMGDVFQGFCVSASMTSVDDFLIWVDIFVSALEKKDVGNISDTIKAYLLIMLINFLACFPLIMITGRCISDCREFNWKMKHYADWKTVCYYNVCLSYLLGKKRSLLLESSSARKVFDR